jgi:nicotinate-nucleotide adenylyltransferase
MERIGVENGCLDITGDDLRRLQAFGCFNNGRQPNYRHLAVTDLEQVVVSLLKPSRVAHVLGCRDTAVALARQWGADETDAARAGLLHDITKALDGPLQLTLCREYGIVLDMFSNRNPKTLHALTGSLVADRIFGENRAVVDAIRSHTTGKPNMNTLEKIIYVADYMEPNREFEGVEELRRLAFEDLDQALKLGLEMTLEMLRQQGREISPESQETLAFLNNKV